MQDFVVLPCVDGAEREARVLAVDEVVALERRIAGEGTPLLELMARAGAALAQVVEKMTAPGERVVVLAGPGNNGGDGWVAASRLAEAGRDVVLATKEAPEALRAEPARTAALRALERGGFEVAVAPGERRLVEALRGASAVVDAILGTGFAHDEVRAPYGGWIQLANAARKDGARIVAADCPSGLNAQTGTPASECIAADATVTMLVPKTGLLEAAATPYVGSLVLAPLDCEELLGYSSRQDGPARSR